MPYSVKEIYYTLQGEGFHSGRAAVFCRFAGCNLWNGKEEDKKDAACWFCDTDFVGTDGANGGKFDTASSLAQKIASCWPAGLENIQPMIVFTGGEPLLQLDDSLIKECKQLGFYTAVETNGTITAPKTLDWITVSPKPGSELVQTEGSELKLVYPHDVPPESVTELAFEHFYLSPMTSDDPSATSANMLASARYCLRNPQWQLTMQAHKLWGIP